MGRKLEWGLVLGAAMVVAFAVAYGSRGISSTEWAATNAGREEFRRLLAPQPQVAEKLEVAAPEMPASATPALAPNRACVAFYQQIFSEDFGRIDAARMNRLPSSEGCVPDKPLAKGVVDNYENSCRKGVDYPANYVLWSRPQKERAKNCLMWVWFLRSAVLAERMKDENPGNVADAALLSTWLFGTFLAMDFERLPPIAHRLSEVDPHSVLGAKAALMKPLAAIGNPGDHAADEAFWTDSEREWRRASELAPGDKDVEFAGIMLRTHNMELPRLRKELEEREAAYGANDPLGAYLGGYYASKTQSKEAAVPLLMAGAKRFPADAERFRKAAEACRTKPKCEFQLTYGLDVTHLVRTEDVIR